MTKRNPQPQPHPAAKTVCVRGFDCELFALAKARAKAEGLLVRDWIERALTHELARSRKTAAAAASSVTE